MDEMKINIVRHEVSGYFYIEINGKITTRHGFLTRTAAEMYLYQAADEAGVTLAISDRDAALPFDNGETT
jgi:hypothetical protein